MRGSGPQASPSLAPLGPSPTTQAQQTRSLQRTTLFTSERVVRQVADRYPAVRSLWENAWAEFVPFLDYSPEIRRVIYSTNAIESLHARFRRPGSLPQRAGSHEMRLLSSWSMDPTGKGQHRWMNRWKPALNAFAVTFGDRIFTTTQWPNSRPDGPMPLAGDTFHAMGGMGMAKAGRRPRGTERCAPPARGH